MRPTPRAAEVVRDSIGKPLDVGNGRVCASFDARTAAWLSIGRTHPAVGFVELSAVPTFDERGRGDPAAARRHRLAMTDAAHALLTVQVDGLAPELAPEVEDPSVPRWRGPGVRVEAWAAGGTSFVVQRWVLEGGPRDLAVRVRGRIDRPALAEITETDPPAPTGAATTFAFDGGRLAISAPSLPEVASVQCFGASVTWRPSADGYLGITRAGEVRVVVALGPESGEVAAGHAPEVATDASFDPLTARSLAYVRGCTALGTGADERAFLTDHRILPLSWTRDAYWQALTLLAADGQGDRERVADHLRWLWRRCERPGGRWVRSHHADGRRKDLAFQPDQQLYPMVELADYWRLTGALPDGVLWPSAVAEAWSVITEELDRGGGLLASAENAADDPTALPFIGSSQVLAWYTAMRLAELTELRLPLGEIHERAASIREAFMRFHAGRRAPWAYAVDAQGSRVDYHDANDLPIALAPLWGFCTPEDPGWAATMEFAFSPSNPAWADGGRPGLGSAHTPGPWTLGDVQAWIVARTTGRSADADAALRRLASVAFGDGMLPEAYAADGPARVRHWFAWPGAVRTALLLLDRAGRLETTLGVGWR